nr:VCBS domain-containing protein [Shewanella rhizosphaerae]
MDTVSGKLAASGDTKDAVTWSVETSKGQYGDLVLNPSTGEWHYHLNNFDAKTNALFEGEHHNETFTITATDNLGNRVSSVIRVSVEGSNDLPVISGVHHASLNELGSVDRVSGQLIATDPDTGDSIHWAVPHSSGVYGELVIDPDTGVWQYRLDNSSPNTLALHAGQVATETFRVTATDSSGQPVSQIVTIAVHGADQRAIIHGMASGSVTEDRDLVAGQLQTSGQLTVIDPDGGDAHFIATTLQGQYGTLTINDLGHWTYTADNSQTAIQGLKSGESLTETLFVHSVDGTAQKVTVTINGTDDRAVIGAAKGAVTEDKDLYQGQLRVDGTLTVTDADSGQTQFQATSLQGQFGTLSIDSNGHWSYTADNAQTAIQGLKSGESLTETLYVHSIDGTEQKVTVTINGTDDRAVIGGASTGSVTEDKDLYQGQLRVDGALTVTDADHGEAQFVATSLQGQYGTLTINDLGHWTYKADNSQAAIQGLKSGESLTETLFVHSIDGSEQKVTVTINGTDDKAVIGGASTGAVTEDRDLYQGLLRIDGALTVSDADSGQNQFIATSLRGQYGTLTINDLGHWTYTADNSQAAIQGLKSGESLTETLLVHSIDGSEQNVTVTINGTDDKAVIGGAASASVTEDRDLYQGQLRVDGALTVTDADHGEAQFVATSLQGQYGTLSINDLGHWTYTADNSQTAIQGLKSGESLTETLLVHSVDGTEQKVTVTINGTDDRAVIGGTATGTVNEDRDLYQGQLRVDGALTVTDADHGEAQFVATTLQGQYGTLTINDLGHWTYTADNSQTAIQELKSGESLTETLFVHSVDGSEQKVTVTINGTDDKAVIGGASTGAVTEDRDLYQGQLRVDGALTVTDADSGQNQFIATSLQGQYGTLTINDLGHWTYKADNSQAAIQGLKSGESLTETLFVHSIDGTEQKVTVTINGTDDKAVIGGPSTGAVTEDRDLYQGLLRIDGALTVSDADSGQNQFIATSLRGQYGTLTINDLGHWTYTADNSQAAIQGLKSVESLTETLFVHSIDGSEQKVTVTINGTDDKAVIGGAASASVTEDRDLYQGQLRVDGALTVTDADHGEAQFVATSLQGQYGTLTINDLGHWTYTADNSQASIQGLKSGESLTETLLVHSIDGTEQKVTVTINGTDDRAVIGGTATGTVTEDKDLYQGQLRVDGALTVTDADSGQNQFIATSLQGQYGTLTINDLGHWSYTADNSQPAIQGLKSGESLTETLFVHSVDGTEQKVTVTINGTDDRAVIGGTATASVTEDRDLYQGQLRVDGALTVTDADSGQNQFIATSLQGQYGTLTINDLGHWTYTADNAQAAIQELKSSESLTETLFVHSIDGTEQKVTVSINGTDDKAVIGGASTGAVTEDRDLYQGQLRVDGALTVTDADSGQNQFVATSLQGQYGTLTINDLGHWTYTADNSQTAIQGLKSGESLTETLFVHSIDGSEHKVTVSINGTDDKAIIVGTSTGTVTEDRDLYQGQLRVDGALTVTDADSGQNQFIATSLQGQYGTLTINDLGHWTYSTDNSQTAIQGLKSGESLTETLLVHSVDGTETPVTITIQGTDDKAIIGGVDTADVHENHSYQDNGNDYTDRSPDHSHGNIAKLWNDTIHIDGKLTIIDADNNEASFNTQQGKPYTGQYGQVIMQQDGSWSYYVSAGADTVGRKIDQLGEGQSFTDTITVYAKDGTSHDIVITIHGDNDRPYCSSEVLLHSGREDTTQVLTQSQLLQNTVDVDANDLGRLTIENLRADHGSIAANPDGSFSFTPEKDYNGAVHFTYDVKDAHGGVTHTGASTTLAAVNDAPDVSPFEEHITEGEPQLRAIDLLQGATDKEGDSLSISHLSISVDGQPTSSQLPAGVTLAPDGHSLVVDATDPAFEHLAKGQNQAITLSYRVEDGHGGSTEQTAKLIIQGTDDKASLVSNVIQMTETQAIDSQKVTYRGHLQLFDPDSGDQTDFMFSGKYIGQGMEPGHLTIWPGGKYEFDLDAALNHHADDLVGSLHSGESMEIPYEIKTSDGQRLTIMVKIIGEDNQARIEVGKYSSLNNHAYEDHLSPGNTPNQIWSGGNLTVIDPDHDQAGFIPQSINTPEGGHFQINASGRWSYTIDNANVQHLGSNESFNKTFTVTSIDGSASQTISVTVHGTNDKPVISSAVRLGDGQEDTQMRLTPAQLLAHAKDVDDNDAGQLTVANLQADHGTITTNPDGSFTFTPEKDYNGAVHFTYDVKDAHGGVTHTGASTTLAAVSDQAQVSGDTQGELVEDQHQDAHNQIAISGQLNVQDPDAGQAAFQAGTATQVDDPFGGSLHIGADGSWTYDVDNARLQQLSEHQEVLVTHRVYTLDGTAQDIVIKITGTNDAPKLGVVQLSSTTGHLTVQDPDSQDSHSFSVAQQTGQFGTLVVDPDTGAYSYRLNQSVAGMHYDKASGQYQGTDTFEVQVSDNHGGSETKFISFDARVSLTMPTGTGLQPQLHATVTSPSQLVDTKPQQTPTQTIGNAITLVLSHSSDTGVSDSDGITHDTHPVVEGQTDIPFSLVTLYEQGNKLTSVLSDAQGHYSVALSGLSEGVHQLTATAQAPGSQQTVQATPLALTLDTQTDIAVHSASLNGHGELVVQVYLPKDSELTQLVISSSGGGQPLVIDPQHHDAIGGSVSHPDHQYINFEHIDLSSLPDGELTISVRGQDVAGNQASASSSQFNGLPLSLNTNIPPLTLALTHDTGQSSSDGITTDASLTIGGQLAGMRVEYSIDGGQHWQSQFTPVQGHNQLWVRQTDAFGHASPHTQLDFELDNQAPLPQIRLDAITPDNLVNAAEAGRSIAVTGSVNSEVPAGTPITLAIGQQTYQGQVDSQGHFSVQVPGSALAGAHEINASLITTDLAGNQGSATESHQYRVDTQASIDMNPIAGDNMLQAGEQHQALTISGTVTNVEEGQRVTVSIGGQQYHANVHNGCWSTQLSAAEVDALPGGSLEIKAMVSDLAGNHAQMSSPLYVVDHANPIPSMSFLTPPTPTGTGAIGSHISGDLIAPPLLQQLTPNAPTKGAWAIDDGHGHPTLSLRGQYGTLTIDPDTGHVDYVYNQAPTPGDKAAGGTHWAGETTSETHHDIFHILYHDSHSSNVDVEVNLDITYVHGHSGHNQLSTQLVDMTVTPVTTSPAPPPPPPELHDTPQWDGDQDAIDDAQVIVIPMDEGKEEDKHAADLDDKPVHSQPHELAARGTEPSHTEADGRPLAAAALAPVDHYLQMVGLSQHDLAQVESHTKPQPDLETPLMATEHFDADDLTLTQADQFDNPLLEEHEKEKPHPSLVDIDDPRDDQHASAHHDDLLHNALNDMHNQF